LDPISRAAAAGPRAGRGPGGAARFRAAHPHQSAEPVFGPPRRRLAAPEALALAVLVRPPRGALPAGRLDLYELWLCADALEGHGLAPGSGRRDPPLGDPALRARGKRRRFAGRPGAGGRLRPRRGLLLPGPLSTAAVR